MKTAIATGLVAILLLLAGCGTAPTTTHQFLSDYSRLTSSAVAPGALAYHDRQLLQQKVEAFAVEPLVVLYVSEAEKQMADPAREAEVRSYLTEALEKALKARSQRGSAGRMIKVRCAITGADPAQSRGTFQSTTTAGGASFGRGSLEVEMLDSKTGAVVLAFVDHRDRVRPSGPQQLSEAKRQIDDAIARLLAEFDAARAAP